MKRLAILSLLLPLVSLIFVFFFRNNLPITGAATEPNIMRGWAWSTNIGWISLTCDHTEDGTIPPYSECGSNGSAPQYQVTIDPFTGKFGGYAWSPTIGWISFNPVGPYPANPQIPATLVQVTTSSGEKRFQIQGWARACAPAGDPVNCSGSADPLSQNTGGWDGWIKFSGSTTNCPAMANPSSGPYETCLTKDGNNLEGWAWGSDTIGWVQFDPAFNSVSVPPGSSKIIEVRPH